MGQKTRRSARLCALVSAWTLCASMLYGCLGGSDSASGSGPTAQASAVGAQTQATQVPNGADTQGPLSRMARWMVDGQGRVVLLHGVNAVWKLKPYAPPDSAFGFSQADADWLSEHGFNSVRLGVLFAGVMPKKGVIDFSYLERIDRVVQLLAARGIWVMLDFHQDLYSERFNGEGFPDWSVFDDGLPHPRNFGFPANYLTPETTRTFDNLYANRDGIWDHYRAAWVAVARKWKDQPYLMGYDLINEPWTGSQTASCAQPVGCPLFDSLLLQAFQQHMLDGIRTVDRRNIVWMEPNILFDFGAKSHLGSLTALKDPQLGLSWHTYCLPAALLHSRGVNDVPGCTQLHQTVFANAQETIARMNATSVLSEFGASDDLADLRTVTAIADQQLTGWQYWHYKGWNDPTSEDPTGFVQSMFAKDADLSSVKKDKLKLLERAYPMATAGIPVALGFNPDTAVFTYRYTPGRKDVTTDIHMPQVHYPRGYTVSVSGARVTSEPNARTLRLQNTGSSEVRIDVKPL